MTETRTREAASRPPRIAIIGGAGTVGSALAFNLATRLTQAQILLIDKNRDAAQAQCIDLGHLRSYGYRADIAAAEPAEIETADIVVLAASAPYRPAAARTSVAERNAHVLAPLMPHLHDLDGEAILIVATNPVDAFTTVLAEAGVLGRRQILGFSLNDTVRYRTALADRFAVAPDRIVAWNLGEHGGVQVPLADEVFLDGVRVEVPGAWREEIDAELAGWFGHWHALAPGRTTGWATAAGITAMIEAHLGKAPHAWPCSVLLDGEYGLTGAALALPVLLGQGLPTIQTPPASDHEVSRLREALESVKADVRVMREHQARQLAKS